jgi:dipeptidyl aminopeptidase/acylaminoacyl peptidase
MYRSMHRLYAPVLAIIAVISSSAASAAPQSSASAEDPLIPFKTLLAPATVQAPKLSPDGKYLSFLSPVNGVTNIMVAPVSDVKAALPITRDTKRGFQAQTISGDPVYLWAMNGTHMLYLQDKDGDENWLLYSVNVQTGDLKSLTPFKNTQVRVLRLSPTHPDEALIAVNNRDPRYHDVYRVNVVSGKLELVEKNNRFVAYVADNDLKLRVAVALGKGGGYEILKSLGDGAWQLYFALTTDDSLGSAIGFDASNRFLYAYDSRGRDTAALVKHDLEAGKMTVVASNDKVDVDAAIVHPATGAIQAYATTWTRKKWNFLDGSIKRDFDYLATVRDGDLNVESRSRNDQRWVVRYTLSDAPETFYLYDRLARKATKLFTSTPQLEGLPLTKMNPVVVKSRDGFDLVSYVSFPRWIDPDGDGKPSKPVPMVMIVHGGPDDERAAYGFAPLLQWLCNRGYAVFYVNFRGSPGFGKKFLNAQHLEWGGKMHDDLIDQVNWAVEQGYTLKDKIAILGGSYGGYATLVGMTMTPDVFACGVEVCGPANLETFIATMPATWSLDRIALKLGDPRTDAGRALLKARSPYNFAKQTKHPVLIAQGANDSRVPQAEADRLVEAMVKNGVKVTYLLYPDEGHGFVRPQNNYSFFAITEVFLAQNLGGRYQPLSDELEGSSVAVSVGGEHIPGLAAALTARRDDGLPKKKVDTSVSTVIFEAYAGQYNWSGYKIDVTKEGDHLFLQLAGQPRAEIFPSSETEFFFKTVSSTVTFVNDKEGKVTKLIFTSGGKAYEGIKVK